MEYFKDFGGQRLSEFDEEAEAHWSYIKALLETHSEDADIIEKIGFHYRTAMVHGYKHGIEDALQ